MTGDSGQTGGRGGGEPADGELHGERVKARREEERI